MTTEEIKTWIIEQKLRPAKNRKVTEITLRAGDVHRELGLNQRMPMVCNAMRSTGYRMIKEEAPKSGFGANVFITYDLGQGALTVPQNQSSSSTRNDQKIPVKLHSIGERIIVIQCAGPKHQNAASLCHQGISLNFVGQPCGERAQTCPWNNIPQLAGPTWINCIQSLNGLNDGPWVDYEKHGVTREDDGKELFMCGDIYTPRNNIYPRVLEAVGRESVYILSAGWGLVRADRKIPKYNVTFSRAQNVPPFARIDPVARAEYSSVDLNIPGDSKIHLFITERYITYWNLTFGVIPAITNRTLVHWRQGQRNFPDGFPRCRVRLHNCNGHVQNWHYTAISRFLDGDDGVIPLDPM